MELHEFSTDKNLIIHFIKSQAGSLAKALLEYVQNAGDAKATTIDLSIRPDGFRVADNGEGMPTRELILDVFKRFGFDHSDHQRQWGRFGLGRAQAWNFASTVWRTHGFGLDVDVRERGLSWYLHSDLEHQPGLVIDGRFYEPLSALDQAETIRELARMCRYVDMRVTINGEQVNRPPAAQKWTEETDGYYLSVTDSSYLHVYNMGVFVCDIYAGQAGAGGTVVTKAGHPLTLNVARNDIMRNACGVWRGINERLRQIAKERADKPSPTQRTTDADRDYMAQRTMDPADASAFEGAMFTLTTGRSIALQRLNDLCSRGAALTTAKRGDVTAERLYREGRVVPLSEATLERFGVRDVAAFKAELLNRLDCNTYMMERVKRVYWHPYKGIQTAPVHESIKECPGYALMQARTIPQHELSKADKTTLTAIKAMSPLIACAMRNAPDAAQVANREILIGQSSEALAYTDGTTYIAVVDTFARECVSAGLKGFHRLASVLVHEYLHSTSDAGSHTHDAEFLEAFHDVLTHQGAAIADAAMQGYSVWAKSQARLSRARAVDLDRLSA